jgi:hypothetical protein
MGTNCAVYLANFYLFTFEFHFIKRLLKSKHALLCFIDCPWFIGLWMIFLFLIFQTLRISCTSNKALL